MIYVNTEEVKIDCQIAEKALEKKMLWDEENRLQAIDINGYVSNYTYDAGGERVTKLSGGGQGIFVNSVFAGGKTSTSDFTLYVNPYLVAQNGGRYTKHIYIGSQRIVSKLGDFDSYGADPRRVEKAGESFSGLKVNYDAKYKKALEITKANYDSFDVPYYGVDNNDYVNGLGFCCNPSQDASSSSSTTAKSAKNDNAELQQFYYHPDHLGSSSYISNLDGEVVQHIEYVPFGEVFLEEKNAKWNTPYLFTSKELDRETGLYYYGARYYDPKISIWTSVDPILLREEIYENPEFTNGGVYNSHNLSSYSFSYNSPIVYVDPNGECPNCVTAAAGAVIGGIIGGAIEAGTQLYRNGKVNNWKAVGGSALQGAIVGGAAGFTGGASLAVTAGVAGSANAIGGTVNRAIQDKETTAADLLIDFSIGAVIGAGAKYIKTPFGSGTIKGGAWIETTENMSAAAAKYQTSITGQAANKSFLLKGVKFDGFSNGILQDAKSGMGNFVDKATGSFKPWFTGGRKMIEQAERQIGAANGTKIQWFFENKSVMEATQKLFKKEGIKGIELIYKPN
ncbi:RHS repeat-associated core domain-containing protein [Flavobacterium sp. KACC 22761]|uniref:RHS repeat-associated core domain-containing protein n=1 Tax=Flavobacterium sp. KACC 22761 TaxID=3092665 RepID=UPI002A750B38|nr:RHS repeat-associated core domain-containing protein [Flavobacterium sp. KACC 22761]WPO78022.1 RHS repeat-associated core domain-containing protein [Flavobacterium sp. KACC 22761]